MTTTPASGPTVASMDTAPTTTTTTTTAAASTSTVHPGKFFLVSSLVGLLDSSLFYPLDLMRSRQAVTDANPLARGSGAAAAAAKEPRLLGQMQRLYRVEGFRALYRGFWWWNVTHIPFDTAYYFAYTALRERLTQSDWGKQYPVPALVAASLIVDFVSIGLYVPSDIISQRLQVHGLYPQSAATATAASSSATATIKGNKAPLAAVSGFKIFRDIVREEGARGLWRGMSLTMAVSIPASSFWWLMSDQSKYLYAPLLDAAHESSAIHALSGATAGALTTLMFTPADVIRTRLQTMPVRKPIVDIAKDLWQREGFVGFYKGIQPRLISSTLRSALIFTVYEFTVYSARADWSNAISSLAPPSFHTALEAN